MKKIIIAIAFAAMSGAAFADVQPQSMAQPAGCAFSFKVHIDSILLVSKGYGFGRVTCKSTDGRITAKAPVRIDIEGIGPGLGTFDLQGVAGNIGIREPQDLNGKYAVLQANVGVGGAVGANLGFEGQNNGLSFGGSVDAGTGIGGYLNGTRWLITVIRK